MGEKNTTLNFHLIVIIFFEIFPGLTFQLSVKVLPPIQIYTFYIRVVHSVLYTVYTVLFQIKDRVRDLNLKNRFLVRFRLILE